MNLREAVGVVSEKLDRASVWIAALEDCPEAIADLNGLSVTLRAALNALDVGLEDLAKEIVRLVQVSAKPYQIIWQDVLPILQQAVDVAKCNREVLPLTSNQEIVEEVARELKCISDQSANLKNLAARLRSLKIKD